MTADTAYMDNRAYGIHQLTAWIPLMNATTETGCLQVLGRIRCCYFVDDSFNCTLQLCHTGKTVTWSYSVPR